MGRIKERDSTFFLAINRCHTKLCNAESFPLLHLGFSVLCHGWIATGPLAMVLFSSFILKKERKKTNQQPVIPRVGKEKRKPEGEEEICKNEVIPAPDCPGEVAGTPGDVTSALPCESQSLGADHFHSGCQQSWGIFRRLGTEIPQGLDRHTVKGPERITVRNGPTLYFILTTEYLGSVVTDLQGLVGKLSGGKFMTSSSREINRWGGGFPTCE